MYKALLSENGFTVTKKLQKMQFIIKYHFIEYKLYKNVKAIHHLKTYYRPLIPNEDQGNAYKYGTMNTISQAGKCVSI